LFLGHARHRTDARETHVLQCWFDPRPEIVCSPRPTESRKPS
jgi:hypothetical protein